MPEVAQSLPARSADGKTYTFTIRRGFRFSPPSNQPVTAQTFKDSIERTLNPTMKSIARQPSSRTSSAPAPYMAGKAPHIAGVVARGDKLTIRLIAPGAQFPRAARADRSSARSRPTPRSIPKLRRDPIRGSLLRDLLHARAGSRARAQPELPRQPPAPTSPGSSSRSESPPRAPLHRSSPAPPTSRHLGERFYAFTPAIRGLAARSAARYGAGTPQAATQQYFVNPEPELHYFALNTHRPLFSDVQAPASGELRDRPPPRWPSSGPAYQPLPEPPTDHYLPPGIPGLPQRARLPAAPGSSQSQTARPGRPRTGRTAVLYTCNATRAPSMAQIIKNNLGAIGIQVEIKTFPVRPCSHASGNTRRAVRHRHRRLAAPTTPIPARCSTRCSTAAPAIPSFNDPAYQRRLAAAARLSGPAALPDLRHARPRPRPQRRSAGRLRQPLQPRLLLRAHRLPNLRRLRHGPRRALHQERPPPMTRTRRDG